MEEYAFCLHKRQRVRVISWNILVHKKCKALNRIKKILWINYTWNSMTIKKQLLELEHLIYMKNHTITVITIIKFVIVIHILSLCFIPCCSNYLSSRQNFSEIWNIFGMKINFNYRFSKELLKQFKSIFWLPWGKFSKGHFHFISSAFGSFNESDSFVFG